MNRDDIVNLAATGKVTLTNAVHAITVLAVFGGSEYNLAYMNALSMVQHLKRHEHYQPNRDLIVLPKETV